MRLDKFICKSTPLGRPEALRLIHAGAIQVNGRVIRDESTQVHENNRIIFEGAQLRARASRYLMLHKPAATVCSNIDEAYPSLLNCLALDQACALHIAGRLDADTTGLVLATDDGRWSYAVFHPQQRCEKVYRVGLRDPLAGGVAPAFARGIRLAGEQGLTLPAKLQRVGPKEVLLTLTEGKFHQVKRMFASVGNRVVSLHRERIGAVGLDIGLGQWRHLSAAEVASFCQ